jgi:hypothetical protein
MEPRSAVRASAASSRLTDHAAVFPSAGCIIDMDALCRLGSSD